MVNKRFAKETLLQILQICYAISFIAFMVAIWNTCTRKKYEPPPSLLAGMLPLAKWGLGKIDRRLFSIYKRHEPERSPLSQTIKYLETPAAATVAASISYAVENYSHDTENAVIEYLRERQLISFGIAGLIILLVTTADRVYTHYCLKQDFEVMTQLTESTDVKTICKKGLTFFWWMGRGSAINYWLLRVYSVADQTFKIKNVISGHMVNSAQIFFCETVLELIVDEPEEEHKAYKRIHFGAQVIAKGMVVTAASALVGYLIAHYRINDEGDVILAEQMQDLINAGVTVFSMKTTHALVDKLLKRCFNITKPGYHIFPVNEETGVVNDARNEPSPS